MNKSKFEFALPVSIIKEGNSFIAYSPALDLSTVGDSYEEAQVRFEEEVQIFFEEITAKGTIDDALTDLGWEKHNQRLIPPIVVSNQTIQFSVPA